MWVAAALPVYVDLMYILPIADFFVLQPLSALEWLLAAVAAISALILTAAITSRAAKSR